MLTGYCQLKKIRETFYSLIYKGIRQEDSLPVIIKRTKQDYLDSQVINCYQQEYKILKCLNHVGIIKVHDLILQEYFLAIILEDFDGSSLIDLTKEKTLPLAEILSIAIQIIDALAVVHSTNVIHKDINPSNILYNSTTKELKLIDFGIAIQLPKEQKFLQTHKHLEGTLAYISPEQTGRMNRGLDYRSDYYSLGVTLYQLLTQQLPFNDEEPNKLIHAHLAKTPKSPIQIRAEIPEAVSEIVMKLMAKNMEQRYQSAAGLIHDLETCLNQIKDFDEIKDFELGNRDVSNRFIIPNKLYGRESEVKILLDSFERVVQGNSEMMLVAGSSGIGKTVLVNEVRRSVTRQKGYFIKGKFDQLNRNIPFNAFIQAFDCLVKQLLGESDEKLSQWKSKILTVLGNNAQVMINVIPNLEIILGKQPAVAELSGSAVQNRFNLVFGKFIQVFATKEHSLVVFLDDLQWADPASLSLLVLLMGKPKTKTSSLLLLGTYRDNEVTFVHPLALCLRAIKQEKVRINTIILELLTKSDINYLVTDTLLCSKGISKKLSELIYQNTQGNPFYAIQFLKVLHEDNYINFNLKENCWQCDLTKLKQITLTKNVVEFMITRLQKLPISNQNVLKLAACIGNRFDLETLATVCRKSKVEVTDNLWPALQCGLIAPETEIYHIYTEDCFQDTSEDNVVVYRFLHDRVQQAAYSLIPNQQKKSIHHRIGQRLLQNTPWEIRENQIFSIVNQLNYGIDEFSQPEEREKLADLNLIACRKAKSATAYQAGREYAHKGLSLLDEESWQKQYETTLFLCELAAELASLCGDWEEMERWIEEVITNSHSLVDQANVYRLQIQTNFSRHQLAEAISIALEFLRQFGVNLSINPTEVDIDSAVKRVKELMADCQVEELLHLSEMQDTEKIAIVQIAQSILPATYISNPQLFSVVVSLVVSLSIQYGNISSSCHAYTCYGLLLTTRTDSDVITGVKFGHLALELVDKLAAKAAKPEVLVMVGGFLHHRTSPMRETLSFLQAGYHSALDVGNYEFAGHNAHNLCSQSFWCACYLETLAEEISDYCYSLEQINQLTTANYTRIYWQATLNLLRWTENPTLLSGKALQETEALFQWQAAKDVHALFLLHTYKLMLSCLFGDLESACSQVDASRQYLSGGLGTMSIPAFYFYAALSALAGLVVTENLVDAFQQVNADLASLKEWADYAPMNHQHKVDLVEAEKCRVLGNNLDALELYDLAIAGAKENKHIQDEALANELAAKFYLDWGKDKIAAVYFQETYFCYDRWGAKAKTDQLAKFYPELLHPILKPQKRAFHPLEALSTLSTYINDTKSSTDFDLQTRIRSAQAITETLELQELLKKISEVFLQHSGCDRIFIALVNKTEDLQICVNGVHDNIEVNCDRLEVNSHSPSKLINYVKNTCNKVVVNDLETELPVFDDYLLQEKPQSILTLPLMQKDELIGVLYLHSSRISNIFNPEKIVTLEFFCSQAAIALENARLYQERQEAEVALAHKNALLKVQLESSLEGILVMNAKRQIIAYNQRFVSIWQIPEAILATKDDRQFLDFILDQVKDPLEFLNKVEYGYNHLEEKSFGEIALKDQRCLERYSAPVTLPSGKYESTILYFRDISDRKAAEKALKDSQAQFRRMTENVPGMIFRCVMDSDGKDRVTHISAKVREIYELEPETVLKDGGHQMWERTHPDDLVAVAADIQISAETLKPFKNEHRLILPEKGLRWIQTVAQPEALGNGYIAWDGVVIDITERKQAELQLQQTNEELARATRMKDEFLANMSHEFRTPLNAILGMTEGLQEMILGQVNEKQLKALNTIEKSGFHLLELINDILDLAKIESGHLELIYASSDIYSLCQSSLAFVKQQALSKSIQLHESIPFELPNIALDERRIRQVLINLLSNAVKFTPEGGKIFLKVKNFKLEEMTDCKYLTLEIKDTGIGIAPENLDTLFEPFVQIDSSFNRPYEGTGLGLALVKKIVELHGGQVTVSSQIGIGSCFIVKLPYKTKSLPNFDSTVTDTEPRLLTMELEPSNRPIILLAEDNKANINTLFSYLGAKGYCIRVAKNGRVAIEQVQKELPQLIIMDIRMPEVDGLTAIKRIRQLPQLEQIPIIALTALAMEGDQERCLAAGANVYLSKPVRLKKLTLLIQQLLNQS